MVEPYKFNKVRIIDHPWEGETAYVVREEGKYLRCRLVKDDAMNGHEFLALPQNIELIPS